MDDSSKANFRSASSLSDSRSSSSERLRSETSVFVSRMRGGSARSRAHRLVTTMVVPSRRVCQSSPAQWPSRMRSAAIFSSGSGNQVLSRSVVEVPTERLFLSPAVHGLSGAIPESDPVFGVAHHDRVLRQVEQNAVVLLALWERRGSALVFPTHGHCSVRG